MSTYTGLQYLGNGLVPLNTTSLQHGISDLYLRAATNPLATGHHNSSGIVPFGSCEGATTIFADSGELYDSTNRFAYAWTVNVSRVDIPPRGAFGYFNDDANRRQVVLTYGLAMSESNRQALRDDGKTLKVLSLFRLPKRTLQKAGTEDGSCASTLGKDCATALTRAVQEHPHGVPKMPEVCESRLGDKFQDAMIMRLDQAFLEADSGDYERVEGFAMESSGFEFGSHADATLARPGVSDNYGIRFGHSALSYEGKFATRSAIFSRGFALRDELTDDGDLWRALRSSAVMVVSKVGKDDHDDSARPAEFSSLTCVRPDQGLRLVLPEGEGYGNSAGRIKLAKLAVAFAVATVIASTIA